MRGGLAWLDRECVSRYDKMFVDLHRGRAHGGARRHRLAAESAAGSFPRRRVLQSFRDLTASGFWTTKMGIKDLQYMGNVFVGRVEGVPRRGAEEARNREGVKRSERGTRMRYRGTRKVGRATFASRIPDSAYR